MLRQIFRPPISSGEVLDFLRFSVLLEVLNPRKRRWQEAVLPITGCQGNTLIGAETLCFNVFVVWEVVWVEVDELGGSDGGEGSVLKVCQESFAFAGRRER